MIVLCFDFSHFRLVVAAVVLIHRWVFKVVPAHAPRIAAPEARSGLTRKSLEMIQGDAAAEDGGCDNDDDKTA